MILAAAMIHIMMIFLVKAVLLLVAAVTQIHSSSYFDNTIYVTPNISTTPCPTNALHCYESVAFFLHISYIANASNTTVVFLSGKHSLELGSLLLIQDKAHISWVGSANINFTLHSVAEKVLEYGFDSFVDDQNKTYYESSARIMCTNHSGFAFANVSNLTLANLTLINCGQFYSVTGLNASIHLVMVYNLLMEGVSIQNGTGYGLLGVNVLGQSQIINSSFIGNNQFYKNLLKNESIFNCKNEIWINYMYQWTSPLSGYGGGNVLFKYQNVSNTTNIGHQLRVSYILVALGIDGFTPSISLGAGLSIAMYENVDGLDIIITNVTSYRNQAFMAANFYFNISSKLTTTGLFSSYAASKGPRSTGVQYELYSSKDTVTISDSIFECNNVVESVYIRLHSCTASIKIVHSTFRNDFAAISSLQVKNYCATDIVNNVTIKFCNFSNELLLSINYNIFTSIRNIIHADGLFLHSGPVEFQNSIVGLNDCNFTNLTVNSMSTVIKIYGDIIFKDVYTLYNGGALYLVQSSVVFTAGSNVLFYNNSAMYGGAIYMDTSSNVTLGESTSVSFIENQAIVTGGAIYIESAPAPSRCFLQLINTSDCPSQNDKKGINMYFKGNIASLAGSVLYGGNIDSCEVMDCNNIIVDLMNMTDNAQNISSSLISSDPNQVCQCKNTVISCGMSLTTFEVYPGQNITASLVAVGENNGTAPALVLVYSELTSRAINHINTGTQCDAYNIPYRLMSEILVLVTTIQNPRFFLNYKINVSILPCPLGFTGEPFCVCNSLLKTYSLICNISDQTVQVTRNMWIGLTSGGVLAVQSQCPLDYCSQETVVNVFNFDSECIFNRSSVLCGRCQGNLSMTFGTSQCKQCSNYYLLLIIPFAIVGLLLVTGLVLFNITISTGALNGIVLYVNIVRINNLLFIQNDSAFSKILTLLIAWMNLDLGIETCFYDGMNSIVKTWLQFVFPTYIFALVGIIILTIIAGRHSSRMSKLCRFNTFPALAALIHLSYSKILRTIITIFSFVQLDTQNSMSDTLVWQYDGNVEYLGQEHLPIFIFGVFVTLVFIIPFPTLLLLAPFLQAWSHKRYFHWVNKLKVFFDSYQAPFKSRYRFWPGFFLFIHLPLYLVFTISNNPSVKMFAIVIFSLLYLCIVGGLSVYRNCIILLLEMFFILNLGILSALQIFWTAKNNFANVIIISSAIVCAIMCIGVIAFQHIRKNCRLSICNASSDTAEPLRRAVPHNAHANHTARLNILRESLLDDRSIN